MIKAQLILIAVRFVMGAIALGLGIWYLSSAIGGAAITYTSMDNFMNAIGGADNVAGANGCWLCGYVAELFGIIGRATEMFWTAIVGNLWIIMAVGFGIFVIIHTGMYLFDAMKKTATLDAKEKKLELKAWGDKIWKQGLRVVIVGALMGTLSMGGTTALRTVSQITITPVMFLGAELAMAASGISDSATCDATPQSADDDILNPILKPFMCTMGNLNSVMLAGAAGGFALMNYAWLGLGGGAFTWLAGLTLVLMFLIIGFDLFFQVLSVIFKLIFIIIFMPILLAAAAFEPVWKAASGLTTKAIQMLVQSAVQIIGITLKILILYATVSYAADAYFPGPADGYSAILPPLMGQAPKNPDTQALSVMNVFSECERVALTGGEMDADKFKACFNDKKSAVEAKYPGAFDFMADGFGFLLLMFGLFFLYYYAVAPKVDAMLPKESKESFDFGGEMKKLGKQIWNAPIQIAEKVTKAMSKK